MKESIIEYAKRSGFDDIRFAPAVPLKKRGAGDARHADSLIYDPKDILSEAKCVIVLFARYTPVVGCGQGEMCVSEYNRVSSRSYHKARDIAGFLVQNGVKAVLDWRLYAKGAALLTGGFAGRNGLYYHETLGSAVCLHTIVTDLAVSCEYESGRSPCGSCRACENACPTGAISQDGFHADRCMRKYLNGLVPEAMRSAVYQLFGCEICQAACPLNKKGEVVPLRFKTAELLNGEHTAALALETGKNTARSRRVLSQALLYAGAVKDKTLLPLVKKHTESANETVKEHALWAEKRMKDEL